MSYCRFGEDSDIYFLATGEGFQCCWCGFDKYGKDIFKTRLDALNHLVEHIKAGHKVPDYAFERLQQEIMEELEETIKEGDPS